MIEPSQPAVQLGLRHEGLVKPLLPMPDSNPGFQENQAACFVASNADGAHLRIDDAPLERVASDGVAGWRWQPGFYAGEVQAELIGANERVLGRWRLDVSPDPAKLGRDLYLAMLEELMEFEPGMVIGQEHARTRLGALGVHESPVVALARLKSRHFAIRRALHAIVREPIRSLRARRRIVPLHAVRRADHRTALDALRRPGVMAAIHGSSTDDDAALASLFADVPDTERHLDCPANRCVVAMLRALERRCGETYGALSAAVAREAPSETVSGLADRWPVWRDFLEGFRGHVQAAGRRHPFREVSHAEITVAGLNAVSAHPLYARFWRLSWEALRTGLDGPTGDELLPLSPTWEIYERWCFVELARRLQEWLPELDWSRRSYDCHEGHAAQGTVVRLRLQPTVRCSNGVPKDSLWSLSRQRIPDIVLTWERPGSRGFVVLDAKYSVTRPNVLDAMQSAHIYQDALRLGDESAQMSLLLVPERGGAPWLESKEFIAEHRVGVIGLRPGVEPPEWFRTELLDACMGAA